MEQSIAMIGAGNMARALIGGLIERGHPAGRLVATDPDESVLARLERDFGVGTRPGNAEAAADADIVVLAVKPQVIDDVARSIADALDADALVVSVAAGVPIDRLVRNLGDHRAVVRVMPNTPALRGAGATGLYAGDECTSAQRAAARELFEAVGRVFEIDDERLMDAVTAVSGSGPAYFFALTEALAEAGVGAGLDRETAEGLAAQTAAGAGTMLAAGDATAAELRERVTSPGGTTAAALTSFEQDGLATIVGNAVGAAVRRGRELGGSS
ncbi:MAG: pyrroline-5-carboxylate reductase [Candidatus Wenzhouxiangella sp. M2_3B_020]